jgi:hypothetical protein
VIPLTRQVKKLPAGIFFVFFQSPLRDLPGNYTKNSKTPAVGATRGFLVANLYLLDGKAKGLL